MSSYFIDTAMTSWNTADLSLQAYKLVCRTDFSQPGFALIRLPADENSKALRKKMWSLKNFLSDLHQKDRGKRLAWFNMSRFDQKSTTKPHRDAAPIESLLMLGYEPSPVSSKISLSDYSQCAHDLGLTPDTFLANLNPMYEKGLEMIARRSTHLVDFDPGYAQILIVNNSAAPLGAEFPMWQGVLHSATVLPSDGQRIINSTCIFPLDAAEKEPMEIAEQIEFLERDSLADYS